MSRSRNAVVRVFLLLALVGAGGAAYVGYRAFWLPSSKSWPREAFTPERWHLAAPEQRYVFWKDLDERRLLVGRTRAEVEALLGPPDKGRGSFVVYVVKDHDPREYSLNAWYGIQLDLDRGGRVSRVFVRHD